MFRPTRCLPCPIHLRTCGGRRRGQVLVTAALALVALLGMAALSIDYAIIQMSRQQLQDAVDSAALAGAGALQYGIDQVGAKDTMKRTAASNYVLGKPLTIADADLVTGAWNETTKTIVPWSPTFTKAVCRCTGRRTISSTDGPLPLTFSRIFGICRAEITATATAGVIVSNNPRRPVEICVVQDGSGSFEEEWDDAIDADFACLNLINSVAMAGDRLSFVAFSDELLLSNSYTWVWNSYYREYVKQYKPTYKHMTDFGTSRTSLPSAWTTHKNLLRNQTSPNGYTAPAVALNWALDDYDDYGDENAHQQSIVLVSDGMPYGSTSTITQQRRTATVNAANTLAARGVRIHTVTLTAEDNGPYGQGGADFDFNESLVRNGGVAFRTADPARLMQVLVAVGTIEVGSPNLMD